MGRSAALSVALSLADRPMMVRYVRRSPLPDGIQLLLQVAADEMEAIRTARVMTGRSQAALQEAAGFFIEQVLFHRDANSYRILGASPSAPRGELRRNMALLVKWLHPDGQERRASRSDLDRSVFIHRVTQAWENLKTKERRAAYDRSLTERPRKPLPWHASRRVRSEPHCPGRRDKPANQVNGRRTTSRRLVVYRFERAPLWSRILTYLWMRS